MRSFAPSWKKLRALFGDRRPSAPQRGRKDRRREEFRRRLALQPLEDRRVLSAVSVSNATAEEGLPLVFNVSLSSAPTMFVTVNYSTATISGQAQMGEFASTMGSLMTPASRSTSSMKIIC